MKDSENHIDRGTALAVDLGGTKILVGEVDALGNVLRCKKYISEVSNQINALEAIISSIDDYMKNHVKNKNSIKAIGVGMIGRVDKENGIWHEIDPERSESLTIRKILSDKYNLPCGIDNDVRCAVAAEDKLGWGNKSSNYIYINIGTGIAAGFVTNGMLIRGGNFNAGEIGHHVVHKDSDVECCCGRIGCVEAIASGVGMDSRARKLKEKYPTTKLCIPAYEKCSAEEIFRLSDEGDPLCLLLADDAVDAVATLIMNLVRVSDPDTIILGGGVISSGWLLKKIQEKLNKKTMRFVKNGVVLTHLNPDIIGLIGAGIIGIEQIKIEGEK